MIKLTILYNSGAERVLTIPDAPAAEMNMSREDAVMELFQKVSDLEALWLSDITGNPVFMRCRDFSHIDVEFIDAPADAAPVETPAKG